MIKNKILIVNPKKVQVDDKELVKRLLNRAEIEGRSDDADEKIISNRIAEYNKKTAPLADYYQKQEKYTSIKGTGTVDDIFKNLCSTIEKVMC